MKNLILICLLLAGCSRSGKITAGRATVLGVPDAGKPATLSTGEVRSGVAIPKDTPVTITETEAQPATESTPFKPATRVVAFVPAFDTKMESVATSLNANTGTVDTSIAMKRIEVQSRQALLYAAIGSLVAGGVFIFIKYPTPAYICGGAAAVFFAAWKMADLPSWFWALGVAALAGAFFLWRGHEKGEAHTAAESK